jgi:hypothetical protein
MNPSYHYLCKTLKNSVCENSSFTASNFLKKIDNNLPDFQDSSSVMCPEIFSEGARPDQKLEGENSRRFCEIR